MRPFAVRPYQRGDQSDIEALELRVQPYEPEHAPLVAEMHARAARARDSGSGWVPHAPEPDSTNDIARWYAAFWVATEGKAIIGMVGVRRSFHQGAAPPRDGWHVRDDAAELRRLRVAPSARRRGVGAALTRTVIDWCRENGFRVLYLHTTSPQLPARALYESLGFHDIGHVLTGEWEYVWYEMEL
jgi:GNAT superfamily N-acetyltransferase